VLKALAHDHVGVQAALGGPSGELLGRCPAPGAQRQHGEGAEECGAR
jgi:hypothetical protein